MSLTSRQKIGFDRRLLEIEELFRQRKPEIASEALSTLRESDYNPEGFELGLYNLLKARDFFNAGDYSESIKLCERANNLLASSAFHGRA